jgi:hypothetical protein
MLTILLIGMSKSYYLKRNAVGLGMKKVLIPKHRK